VIRVLLAEDQGMMQGALALLLGMEEDIEVVGQVAAGDQVLAAAMAAQPDVALLDIEMPGRSGLDAAADLRDKLPSCRVLILTTFGRPGYLRRAMESGASGFLMKDGPVEDRVAQPDRGRPGGPEPRLAVKPRCRRGGPLAMVRW
jgi:two-component system response regulator DesR